MERSCRTRPQKPQGHFCLLAVRRESLSRRTYKKRGIRFHFLKGGVQGFADRFEEHHTGPVGWWRGGMSTQVGRCVGNPFIKVGSTGRGRRFPGDPECLPSTVTECSLVLKWDMEQVLRELPGAEGAVRPEVSPGGSLLQRWCLKLPGCIPTPLSILLWADSDCAPGEQSLSVSICLHIPPCPLRILKSSLGYRK